LFLNGGNVETFPDPNRWHTGRTAVVTGGGRGIGRAIALALADGGATVFILGRDRARLEEACRQVRSPGSGTMVAVPCDIRDERAVDVLGGLAPHIDILVHNAAAYAPYVILEKSQWETLQPVWETIVTAPIRLTRGVLPSMKARGFGRILHIGSAAATLGGAGQVAYASAKSALAGLTRSVACEAGRYGVTCNLVEVGFVETERTAEAVSPERKRQLLARIPSGRAGTCAEVAAVVSFLTSAQAGYIQGACIPVTGGLGLGLFPFGKEGADASL
jgi:NAD(P)-dependent dehydrogenase (short-subunit alcohol dehydrogenase family)